MRRCPVCEKELTQRLVCDNCGFDRSCNYEQNRTLCSALPKDAEPISVRAAKWKRRKQMIPVSSDGLVCPKCGGGQFYFLADELQFLCADCETKLPAGITEEPKPDKPKPDEPIPEDPKPEKPKPEKPKPEKPKLEKPKPEKPKPRPKGKLLAAAVLVVVLLVVGDGLLANRDTPDDSPGAAVGSRETQKPATVPPAETPVPLMTSSMETVEPTETLHTPTPIPTPTPVSTAIASGACGENVSWTLDNDGLLTISGTGAMTDYGSNYNDVPWYKNRVRVKEVVIEGGVTSIGVFAFYKCSSLTGVTIPNSVTSIGNYAFSECTKLTGVTIPNSVTSIGNGAFSECTKLTGVTIGNGVISIGERTFWKCTNLTSVTIGNSVTSIGESAFYKCESLIDVTIPNSVTSIGGHTFYECKRLRSVTISSSVTNIGEWTFYQCTSLTSVTIPSSVIIIYDYAFYGCSRLTDVYYSGSEAQWKQISYDRSNDPLIKATKHFGS